MFKVMHVPTWSDLARVFVCIGIEAQGDERQGQGALVRFLLWPHEHHVAFHASGGATRGAYAQAGGLCGDGVDEGVGIRASSLSRKTC